VATLRQMSDTVLTASGLGQIAYRDEVRRIVSDVYQELALSLRLNLTGTTVTLTDAVDYSISGTDATTGFGIDDMLSLRSIVYAGVGQNSTRTLGRVTPDEVLARRATIATATGGGLFFAHPSPDVVMFYPNPTPGDQATIYYSARPEALSGDDDEPTLVPAEFHYVIEDGALERALRYKKKPNGPGEADRYRSRYRDGVNQIKRWRNHSLGAYQSRTVVGRRYAGRRLRRDQDWGGE
jgi:hypothetical protein